LILWGRRVYRPCRPVTFRPGWSRR
jgi:hypothetical protein